MPDGIELGGVGVVSYGLPYAEATLTTETGVGGVFDWDAEIVKDTGRDTEVDALASWMVAVAV